MPMPSTSCPRAALSRRAASRAAALLFVAALFVAAALLPALAQAQGITVAVGGALQDSNHALWMHLVQLVQREPVAAGSSVDNSRACYSIVTIASADPDASAKRVAANLARQGGRSQHLRVGTRIEGQDVTAAVHDPQWVQALRRCRGVYMTGGSQARLIDTLQPQGRATPLLLAMRALWQEGGVVAGSSAGAAVLSDVIFRDAPDPLAVMKGRLREGIEWDHGFAFAPTSVLLDQHAVRRGRIGRLLPLMQSRGVPVGVAVEENSAVQFQGQEVLALGARGLLIADIKSASGAASGAASCAASCAASGPTTGPFELRGARLHWLEHGDRFDLATRTVKPSARKLAGTLLQPLSPQHRGYLPGPWFYADMLGDGVVVTAMTRLVDGDQPEQRGLSFAASPAADDPAPDLAFEWRLWLDEGTRGWLITSPEGYTLSDVRLDIVPVRVNQPLYRPLTRTLTPTHTPTRHKP